MQVLIVDDEKLARARLIGLLKELDDDSLILEAEHGLAALQQVNQHMPDIVLLDIRMPLMDGMEVAHHLNRLESPPAIIFTTAYSDYALAAFDINAVAYLLKPIRKERLQQALNRAKQINRTMLDNIRNDIKPRTHLSMSAPGGLKIIAVEKVCFFKASQKYVTVAWDEGELLVDDSLKSLEQEFDPKFMRIHRNTLVACRHIQGLIKNNTEGLCIKLYGIDSLLPISRRHSSHVKKVLKNLRLI